MCKVLELSVQRPQRFCHQPQLENWTVSLAAQFHVQVVMQITTIAQVHRSDAGHACSVAMCSPAPATRTGIDAFQPVVSLRKEATSVPFSPGTAPRIAASTLTSTLPSGCCCCRALTPTRTTDVICSFCKTHRRTHASWPAAGLAVTCYLLVARIAVGHGRQQKLICNCSHCSVTPADERVIRSTVPGTTLSQLRYMHVPASMA